MVIINNQESHELKEISIFQQSPEVQRHNTFGKDDNTPLEILSRKHSSLNKRSRACDLCSSLKVRCDKVFPCCQRCMKIRANCSWQKATSQNYRIGRPPKKLSIHETVSRPENNQPCLDSISLKDTSLFLRETEVPLDFKDFKTTDTSAKKGQKPKGKKIYQRSQKSTLSLVTKKSQESYQNLTQKASFSFVPTFITLILSPYRIGCTKFFLRAQRDCIFIGNSPVSYYLSWYPQSLRILASIASPERLIATGLLPKNNKKLLVEDLTQLGGFNYEGSKNILSSDLTSEANQSLTSSSTLNLSGIIWKLVDLYFYHNNIGYSLLSREFFNQILHTRFHAPEVQLLLNSILMSASGYLPDLALSLKLSQIFTQRTLLQLPRLCRRPRLEVVQALILLSRFPATIMGDRTSHQSWYFHSLAVGMAKSLGLSLFCKNLKLDNYEARKKTWWILYTNDVLFRLHMNKHPQVLRSDARVGLPNFLSHLYSTNYQTAVVSEFSRKPFYSTPGLSHFSVHIRIRAFLIADIAVELHNHYRPILCPPSYLVQDKAYFPFSWKLSEQILHEPKCIRFLLETKILEARLFSWFRWSFGNLLSTDIATYVFEVPSSQDYFSLLALLHFAYLLVELYRPFSSDLFERFQQLPSMPRLNLDEAGNLSETEKCWLGCRIGAASILAREAEFHAIGISGKWVWVQSFFLGLCKGGSHDQKLALGLMGLAEHGAQRFSLAADVLALMHKLIAAQLTGLVLA